jgi:hypothetical protein
LFARLQAAVERAIEDVMAVADRLLTALEQPYLL